MLSSDRASFLPLRIEYKRAIKGFLICIYYHRNISLSKSAMVIILDSIRSIHNVGSIFRTADAAGVKKIYLCGVTPMPTDRFGKVRPQFQKVALGAQHSVEWEYFD